MQLHVCPFFQLEMYFKMPPWHLFWKGHCEHQRNGLLQVRLAGVRKSNKKKVLKKKKDGERNLHFPSCSPDVQDALRETRRTEWNKWMKFNAGVIFDR